MEMKNSLPVIFQFLYVRKYNLQIAIKNSWPGPQIM